MRTPARVVIDTDPGIDDAVALVLAARAPEIEIVAVTTTYGNAGLETTSRNAAYVLALAGRGDVPVRPGSARPLARPADAGPPRHGPDGVGGAAVPDAQPVSDNPSVLTDVLRSLDRPVVLVTLGPLTNLAHAVAQDRELVTSRVERHLGAFGNLGTESQGVADFNTWADPDAAAAVLAADIGTVMIGCDITRRARVAGDTIARLAASRAPLTAWLATALRFRLRAQPPHAPADSCAVHDVVPVAELIAPGLLTLAQLTVSVDLGDGPQRGRTAPANDGVGASVAADVDESQLARLLERVWD